MKRKTLKLGIIVGIFAFFISCNSNAQSEDKKQKHQGPPPSIEELFKSMDENEDGLLSKKEIDGPLKNDFSKIDTDDDGFLSKEEMKKAPKPERREPPKKRK